MVDFTLNSRSRALVENRIKRNTRDLSGDLQDTATAIRELDEVINTGTAYPNDGIEADLCEAAYSLRSIIQAFVLDTKAAARPDSRTSEFPVMLGRRGLGVL